MEQRDAIEEDYNWWRYSKFAAPWLFFLLLIFTLLLISTAFQQVGDLRGLKDGIPWYFQLQNDSDSTNEANLPKGGRNVRIAAVFHTILPVVIAYLTIYSKPRPNTRKIILFVCAFLLFVGSILEWVAFGVLENNNKAACRILEYADLTNQRCDSRTGIATAATSVDFMLALSALTSSVALFYTAASGDFSIPRTGWRQQERDAEKTTAPKDVYGVKPHKVRSTRLIFTSISLVFTLFLAIALTVFVIVLHQDHATVQIRGNRGKSNLTFDQFSDLPFTLEGWSARNTRLRYALSSIAIITILANFLPWRSRIIAYIFAFIYFCVMVMTFVCFALDVYEIRNERRKGCPKRHVKNVSNLAPAQLVVNCVDAPYVNTAIWDMFGAVAILFYLINEYIVRYKSIHSQRKYPWFQIRKIETELDSRRPVRCELTSEPMTAKEYYYKHRFLTGPIVTTGVSHYSGSSADSVIPV